MSFRRYVNTVMCIAKIETVSKNDTIVSILVKVKVREVCHLRIIQIILDWNASV